VHKSKGKQLVFLVYTARSGSTLLASSLEFFSEVGVTIEDKVPWGLAFVDELFKHQSSIKDAILEDKKFKQWGLEDVLISKLVNQKTRKDILPSILEQYFIKHKPEAHIHIYKSPEYIYLVKELMDKYPYSKIIHIYRDPRAVFSSQKKNLTSNMKETFISNPYTFSSVWKKVMAADSKWSANKNFLSVKYEQLALDFEKTLMDIGAFLEIGNKDFLPQSNYSNRIPEDQKHLHLLVGKKPDIKRIEAWSEELSKVEISILQRELKSEMKAYGYKSVEASGNVVISDIFLRLKHYYSRLKNAFKLIFSYNSLKWRLKLIKSNINN